VSNKFKELKKEAQARTAIPQVNPEEPIKPEGAVTPAYSPPSEATPVPPASAPDSVATRDSQTPTNERTLYLTPVSTSDKPVNRGFHMYPSRHTQVTKDLAYIEDRKPWEIIEDALEEYVVKHYGKEHRRK
jgi:hypothetical protein